MTNRSTTAPVSYTNDQFTEDFESRTQKSESEIEDEITGGQLPDSGTFNLLVDRLISKLKIKKSKFFSRFGTRISIET